MSEYILSKLAKIILYISGWSTFDVSDEVKRRFKNGKYILTISHTSAWDALIFLAYKYAHPEIFSNSLIVVKPQIYDAIPKSTHWILDGLGFMKATSYEEKNGGFVSKAVEELNKRKSFLFLISPKGARDNYPWRSGYFHIAKELGCDICACGLDYEKKQIVFFDPISIKDKTREQVEPILKEQIGSVVPLYPHSSEVQLRPFHRSKIGLITISIVIILLILFIIYLFYYNKMFFYGVIFLFFILI